jgi:uncharacterized membrane protein YebE (DUF533 family)
MAFGRRNRRSLLGTAARTAVIAGTATAASNAVNNRTAGQPAAAQRLAAEQHASSPVVVSTEDLLSKLERLAALYASGALTDAEFTAVKASLIG